MNSLCNCRILYAYHIIPFFVIDRKNPDPQFYSKETSVQWVNMCLFNLSICWATTMITRPSTDPDLQQLGEIITEFTPSLIERGGVLPRESQILAGTCSLLSVSQCKARTGGWISALNFSFLDSEGRTRFWKKLTGSKRRMLIIDQMNSFRPWHDFFNPSKIIFDLQL